MPPSEWAVVSGARPVPGGAELSARGEKDGEGEARADGGERRAGERLLGEASGQGGTGGLPDADQEDQPRASLVRPAGARAPVVT
ncbi:hypothetical protein [Streptomyces sp. NPDC057382]|uniref:hypothetical protein n=1 Tax=unclassified Streptomyces TaxID=2593676 RepID=UPI00364069FD